jgi:hypothetical protein
MKTDPIQELIEELAEDYGLFCEQIDSDLIFTMAKGTDSFRLVLDLDSENWVIFVMPTSPFSEVKQFAFYRDKIAALHAMAALMSYYRDVVCENFKNF